MSDRRFDPRSVDIAAFARQGTDESGTCALITLDRLCRESHADSKPAAQEQVQWRATGETRAQRGSPPQVRLHLEARARLSLVCQRCLQPVDTELQALRSFQFVDGEEQAAAIDADSEDDVLPLTRTLDLIELVEDELLLSLPLVPRHGTCPQPLKVRDNDESFEELVHPFAALSRLKRKLPPS